MMGWAKQVLLISTILILNKFQLSLGVRCYQCQWINGNGDRGCQDSPPPSRYLTECSQPQCWKQYGYSDRGHYVKRFCVASAEGSSRCTRTTIENEWTREMIPATECTCNTDGCNTASNLYLNYTGITITVSLATVAFLKKLLMSCL